MNLINKGNKTTLFSVVEIEINTNCNRRCLYCPNSKQSLQNSPQYINKKLFTKIINELRGIGFNGRLSYHFYNEPMLHPKLEEIVTHTSEHLPEARQVLYTNGDFLDDHKYRSLVECGIKHLVVTQHDSKPFPQRPYQTVLHPHQLTLTNRGGNLFISHGKIGSPCLLPHKWLVISYDGRVLLCYEDARRTQVMGDINIDSIQNIWFSRAFKNVRKELKEGNRDINGVCRYCDNLAHIQWDDGYYEFTWV